MTLNPFRTLYGKTLYRRRKRKYDIKSFLEGSGKDDKGRTLEEILQYTDEELEISHDYIQRLFPTDTPSAYHPSEAISKEEAAAITNETIRKNMHRAYERMMEFYGISPYSEYLLLQWFSSYNHNTLRITRILISMSMFGLQEDAIQLYHTLTELSILFPDRISKNTMTYWENAIKDYCR